MNRCKWVNKNNSVYLDYHDNEWGVFNNNEDYLFEMFLLECFQSGLSWECILNKREDFRKNYDNFDIDKIINYDEDKINSLLSNKKLIRNNLKIKASISNAKIYKAITEEYNGFYNYLVKFTKGKIYNEIGKVKSKISDKISKDLYKRGMKYVGSITIYSYLQAIGIINSHEKRCFKYKI